MRIYLALTFCLLISGVPASAFADEGLVEMAQKDLVALGYDPGNIQGEMSTETIVAVSKFQAEHDMEVTGEVTPQLVGALRAALKQKYQPAPTAAAAAPAPAAAPAAASAAQTPDQQQASLQARQQACLQEKYAAAQERQKTKRGLMRMLNAVSRTSNQLGGSEVARTIGAASSTAYGVNATANDLEQAGKDLGLTPDEMEECRNPPE